MSEMSGVYFLSEVRLEEEEEYNNCFRITPECFNELFICSFICSFIYLFFSCVQFNILIERFSSK